MDPKLLILEVVLVSDDYRLYFIVRVVFDLKEPLIKVFEAISFGEVEHQEGGY